MNIEGHEHEISIEIIFQALSSPIRLNIIKLLALGDSCVGAIAEKLDVSQTSISQHLRVLRLAGIANSEKHGRYIHYYLNKESLELLKQFFDNLYESFEKSSYEKLCCHAQSEHCKKHETKKGE
ncbi:MAG: ArsR/SmtB family transcription factor [Candidatus Zixiibacteriota bacterium]